MKSNDNSFGNIPSLIPSLIVDSKEYITDKQKTVVLANSFKLVSSDGNYEQLTFFSNKKIFYKKTIKTYKRNKIQRIIS